LVYAWQKLPLLVEEIADRETTAPTSPALPASALPARGSGNRTALYLGSAYSDAVGISSVRVQLRRHRGVQDRQPGR
jgi:hypothetical protein